MKLQTGDKIRIDHEDGSAIAGWLVWVEEAQSWVFPCGDTRSMSELTWTLSRARFYLNEIPGYWLEYMENYHGMIEQLLAEGYFEEEHQDRPIYHRDDVNMTWEVVDKVLND